MKHDNTPTQWSSLWTAHVKVSLRKQKRVPVSSSGKCVSNSPLPSLHLCVCPDQDSCSVSQHHKCPYWGGLCPYDLSDVKSLRAFVNQPRNVSSPAKKNKNGRETHSQSRKVDISRGSFTRSTWVKWKIGKKKLIFVRTCQAVLTSFTFLSLHYEKWETRETWETRQSNLSKTDRNACKDIKEALYFEGLMVCKWGSVDYIWMKNTFIQSTASQMNKENNFHRHFILILPHSFAFICRVISKLPVNDFLVCINS